jgi:hypothetical protein
MIKLNYVCTQCDTTINLLYYYIILVSAITATIRPMFHKPLDRLVLIVQNRLFIWSPI